MGYLHETGFDGRKRYLSTNQTCKKLHGRGEENCTPRVKKIAPIDNSIDNSVDNTYLQPQADCDVEPEPIENIPLKPEDDPRLIAEVIKQFEGINPTCKTYYGNKTQRKSCSDLIKIYGFEETLHIIAEVLPQSNGKILMAPITTPAELLRDMAKLKAKISQQMNMEFRDFKNKTPAKVDIVNGVPIKRQN